MASKQDLHELKQALDDTLEAYERLKHQIRYLDQTLYERWRAGGFQIDEDILTIYPTAEWIVKELFARSGRSYDGEEQEDEESDDE